MSRLRAMIVLAVAACALAATAAATTLEKVTLRGPIERDGRAEIVISSGKIQGTPVNRYRWEFRRISVRCSGRRETARLPVEGGFAANVEFDQVGDHWGITGTGGGTHETRVSGRLVTRKKARGWVRVFGTAVGIRGGGRESCDSGRLRWVARARG